ncbi:MAG: UPF0158 family protein [Bacteroidales bacterium]
MKLTKDQIQDIAESLEIGMKVYINRENLEYRTVLDWDDMYSDLDIWDNEIEKIETEWNDYVVLEKLESDESFHIMENFIDEVDDENLRDNLVKIINGKTPFANFKAEVELSAYRQQWFNFRTQKFIEHVEAMLSIEDIEYEP